MSVNTAARPTSTPLPFKCPPWCAVDHSQDPWIGTEDFFHRSEDAVAPIPAGAKPCDAKFLVSAHLVDHCNNPEWSCISVGTTDRGFDLETVEQADEYLAHLKQFTAAFEEMRDRLAAIKEQS